MKKKISLNRCGILKPFFLRLFAFSNAQQQLIHFFLLSYKTTIFIISKCH
jgi:hypothetical protein